MKRTVGSLSWIVVVGALVIAATLIQLQRGDAKAPNRACLRAAEAACEQQAKDACKSKRGPLKAACESTTKDACMAEARKRC